MGVSEKDKSNFAVCKKIDVLLIDPSNAFKSMGRAVALHNIQITCPRASTVLINTYRSPSRLFIAGGGELLSREVTTQGSRRSLSNALLCRLYILIISILSTKFDSVKQVWLVDAYKACLSFFIFLQDEGKRYDYYVNAKRSWLI